MGKFFVFLGNEPLALPGVYLIQRLTDGKSYIGAARNMYARFMNDGYNNCSPLLKKDFLVFTKSAYILVPLLYMRSANAHELFLAETTLIKQYNCLNHGYNITLRSGDHMKQTKHRDNQSANMRSLYNDPTWKASHDAAIRTNAKRADIRAKLSSSVKASWIKRKGTQKCRSRIADT